MILGNKNEIFIPDNYQKRWYLDQTLRNEMVTSRKGDILSTEEMKQYMA